MSEDGGSPASKENIASAGISLTHEQARRQSRNSVERKRKEKIRVFINELRELIPSDHFCDRKINSSNTVLESSVKYIKFLRSQNERLLEEHGAQVQADEIERLKSALAVMSAERDKLESMVNSAAVVAPAMISSMKTDKSVNSNSADVIIGQPAIALPQVSSSNVSESRPLNIQTSSADQKQLGQGLIITQTGQAFYVNEQGVPVAQGVAPTLLPPEIAQQTNTPNSQPTSVQEGTTTTVSTTSAELRIASSECVTSVSPCSIQSGQPGGQQQAGLIAVPGHSGQLPSAIILPNGQIIPVVTQSQVVSGNTSTQRNGVNTTAPVSTSTQVKDIAPASAMVWPPAAQPSVSPHNLVMTSQGLMMSNQIGRKIMPKPSLNMTHSGVPMVTPASVTLTPLPACTLAVAPAVSYRPPDALQAAPTVSSGAKRKPKKGKPGKGKEDDILTEATASLFSSVLSTKPDSQSNKNADSSIAQSELSNKPKRKAKKRPGGNSKGSTEPSNVPSKRNKNADEKQHSVQMNVMQEMTTTNGNFSCTEISEQVNVYSQASNAVSETIEFDATDLDLVLDQVENLAQEDGETTHSFSAEKEKSSIIISSSEIISENSEIGHVFSFRDQRSDSGKTKESTTLHEEQSRSSVDKQSSYLSSVLTSTTDQPVDHRRTSNYPPTHRKNSDEVHNRHVQRMNHQPMMNYHALGEKQGEKTFDYLPSSHTEQSQTAPQGNNCSESRNELHRAKEQNRATSVTVADSLKQTLENINQSARKSMGISSSHYDRVQPTGRADSKSPYNSRKLDDTNQLQQSDYRTGTYTADTSSSQSAIAASQNSQYAVPQFYTPSEKVRTSSNTSQELLGRPYENTAVNRRNNSNISREKDSSHDRHNPSDDQQKLESQSPRHRQRTSPLNTAQDSHITAPPLQRSNAFSAEALLNKPTHQKFPQPPPTDYSHNALQPDNMSRSKHVSPARIDGSTNDFTRARENQPAPYNVNLFSYPSSSGSAAGAESSVGFTFSLTKTTVSAPSNSSNALPLPHNMSTSYSQPSLPFLFPHQHSRGSETAQKSASTQYQLRPTDTTHNASNYYNNLPTYPQKISHSARNLYTSSLGSQQQTPTQSSNELTEAQTIQHHQLAEKRNQMNKGKTGKAMSESSQVEGQRAPSAGRIDHPYMPFAASSNHLLDPAHVGFGHGLYSRPPTTLGLGFQSHSFPGLQSSAEMHSSSKPFPHQPGSLAMHAQPPHRFNITNLFGDGNASDSSARLNQAPRDSSMYSSQSQPMLNRNSMSINNLLGHHPAGFDMSRPASGIPPGFPGAPHGFGLSPHHLNFQMSDR